MSNQDFSRGITSSQPQPGSASNDAPQTGAADSDNPALSAATQCPHCKGWFKVASQAVGKNVRCMQCQDTFLVERKTKAPDSGANSNAGGAATAAPGVSAGAAPAADSEMAGMHPALRRPVEPPSPRINMSANTSGMHIEDDPALSIFAAGISPTIFLWLGVLLVVGMVMPIVMIVSMFGETQVHTEFMNFSALSQDMVPGLVKFMCVYPLPAGVALIILGMSVRGKARAGAALAIGLLPIAVLASSEEFRSVFGGLADAGYGGAMLSPLAMLTGWACIFAGCWSMTHRPVSSAPLVVGCLGAGIFALWLILPQTGGGVAIVGMFTEFGQGQGAAGFASALSVAILVILNVIAATFIVLGGVLPLRRYELARKAFTCSVLGVVAFVLLTFFAALSAGSDMEMMGISIVSVFLMNLKMFAWLGGMVLLLPVALADVLVTTSSDATLKADPYPVGG